MSKTIVFGGKESADKIKQKIAKATAILAQSPYNIQPKLSVILVGDNPASEIYIAQKEAEAAKVGILTEVHRLGVDTEPEELFAKIEELNQDPSVSGMILQLPLPLKTKPYKLQAMMAINPTKDADCFHPSNIGLSFLNHSNVVPCTAYGVLQMLEDQQIDVEGKHVVIIGTSDIAGKPLAVELINRNATVTTCNVYTKNIRSITRTADILVVAVGRARYFDASYVNPDCVVIDVGIHKVKNLAFNPKIAADVKEFGYETVAKRYAVELNISEAQALEDLKFISKKYIVCGDVDHTSMLDHGIARISKVPGGVGLLTVANLLHNTLVLCLQQHNLNLADFGIDTHNLVD